MAVTSDAEALSERFIHAVLDALGGEVGDAEPTELDIRDEGSNDIASVRFGDGRTLMIKRARVYPEYAARRFESARIASRLLRERVGVVAPAHLEVPSSLSELPLIAYWRIERPTLKQLWRGLSDREKPGVLRDWGRLLRRIQGVRMPGFGPLPTAREQPQSLETALTDDLEERLLQALPGEWPRGRPIVERLIEHIPEVADRVGDGGGVLCHNDMHMANVLCEAGEGGVRCIGVIDLEYAYAGPAESDIAKAEAYHGRLFGQPLRGRWSQRLWEGYGAPLDPLVLAFFRAYHLANSGFHSALMGQHTHANEIGRAAAEEAAALD